MLHDKSSQLARFILAPERQHMTQFFKLLTQPDASELLAGENLLELMET